MNLSKQKTLMKTFVISIIDKWGVWAKNPKNGKPKFPNVLILDHLKNHF